jgi:hypothetical protein
LNTERVEAANAMTAFIADEADASDVPLSVSRCRQAFERALIATTALDVSIRHQTTDIYYVMLTIRQKISLDDAL